MNEDLTVPSWWKMDGLLSIWDFLVDVICMMPPLKEVGTTAIPAFVAPILFFVSVGLLMVALIGPLGGATRGSLPLGGPVILALVVAISLFSVGASNLNSIFFTAYPAMVISMRWVEGALIGAAIPKKIRLWQLGLVVGLSLVLYFTLREIQPHALVWILTGWSLVGITTASIQSAMSLALARKAPFNSPLAFAGTFGVFAATLLYVSSTKVERELLTWIFPLGLAIGYVGRHRGWFPSRGTTSSEREGGVNPRHQTD